MGPLSRALPLLAACLLVAAPAAHAADDPYTALLAPAGTCGAAADTLSVDPGTARSTMLCLTNYARTHSGLSPLRANPLLNAAGNAKLAADLSCGEFSHTPCGSPFQSVFSGYLEGATTYAIGENIAWGTGSYGTPRSTMNSWLHSTGHRENILNGQYAELGVGYAPGTTFQGYAGATLWSQEFGVRSAPATTPATAKSKAKPAPPKRRRRSSSRR